jgi:predicted phosphoribosyltransferase
MSFVDRTEAGEKLAEALSRFKGEACVIFALPRGGVPVAAPVAEALHAPLDLALVRKIGVPFQPELAMGAVADSGLPVVVRNEDVVELIGLNEAQFDEALRRELLELERRKRLYLRGRPHAEVKDRVAIVVDDGVATGATTRAALRAVRARGPKKLVLAVPVAPAEAIEELRGEADEIVCLEAHRYFIAIGCYYADFSQVEDETVVALLDRFGPEGETHVPSP